MLMALIRAIKRTCKYQEHAAAGLISSNNQETLDWFDRYFATCQPGQADPPDMPSIDTIVVIVMSWCHDAYSQESRTSLRAETPDADELKEYYDRIMKNELRDWRFKAQEYSLHFLRPHM